VSKRIVFNTFGSLGDLHPYLAVAAGLRARGHRTVIATMDAYRSRIEASGSEFAPVRPHLSPEDPDSIRKLMNGVSGTDYLFRGLLMPALRGAYEDLLRAANRADLIVTHTSTFAGPLVAQSQGIRWCSTVLAPLAFFSAYEPVVVGAAPALAYVSEWGPAANRVMIGAIKAASRPWFARVEEVRKELGLRPAGHPMFDGLHSPQLVMAMFSKWFAAPQPDWPLSARTTGFAFFDASDGALGPEVERFLDAGPEPIVFTLGSAAVQNAGDFYRVASRAARHVGVRAILLAGKNNSNLVGVEPGKDILAVDYAPFGPLFARARAIVHSGGIGTTAQALRAGRPMIVVPHSYDQPDTAARAARLGVARTLAPNKLTVAAASRALNDILSGDGYVERAAEVGALIREENGVEAACHAIEQLLAS